MRKLTIGLMALGLAATGSAADASLYDFKFKAGNYIGLFTFDTSAIPTSMSDATHSVYNYTTGLFQLTNATTHAVDFTTSDYTYTVSFAGRHNTFYSLAIDATGAGGPVDLNLAWNKGDRNDLDQATSLEKIPKTTTNNLTFGSFSGPILDDATITPSITSPTPEPEAWATMILGLISIAGVVWYRNRGNVSASPAPAAFA